MYLLQWSREGDAFDYTIVELFRFCELLLAGDPRCVEALFMHPSTVYQASSTWQELCQRKRDFLSRSNDVTSHICTVKIENNIIRFGGLCAYFV